MVKSFAAALAVLAAGCSVTDILTSSFDVNGFSGDPYPIQMEVTSGAIVVGLVESGKPGIRSAVLDVMSPLTLIDRGPTAEQDIRLRDLTLYGASTPGGALDTPRARFAQKSIATIHPCDNLVVECQVGAPEAPRPFDAILGLDAFVSDALRLHTASQEMFIFPDIAGDDLRRSRACDAVLPAPFRGGGTSIIGGAEVSFTNLRIAIDTCLAPNPAGTVQRDRGTDALLVLSTALSTSLLNESAYARYLLGTPTAPALDTLPEATVLLPSGPVSGRLTTIPSLALVANLSSNPRAPCRQVYASHLLEQRNCQPGDDCPCTGTETFCAAPAMIELAPAMAIPFLIVPDSEPTLQALRTELRPDRPEVDGILGTYALAALELDIDFAHDRLLGRCLDPVTCGARPQMPDKQMRATLTTCLGDERGPIP